VKTLCHVVANLESLANAKFIVVTCTVVLDNRCSFSCSFPVVI